MSSELPRVLRRALGLMHFAREAVSASSSSIFLCDGDRDEGPRSLHGLVSDWDWTRTSFSSRLDDWPSVSAALAAGEVRRIDSFAARASEVGWFEARGIICTLCVPLRDGKRPLGVIFFDFATEVPLGKPAMALLEDVGRRCARALARAPALVASAHAGWLH